MRVLHITPHLGGGIGKAHATLNGIISRSVGGVQTFLLLEAPINKRYADKIAANGSRVIVAESFEQVAREAKEADIVQFEFMNHPRLFECFARCDFPLMRSVIWSHISGLFKPVIQPGFMDVATHFVFSSGASRALAGNRRNISVINSGFGFTEPHRSRAWRLWPTVGYLGTVNFAKMHPGFFDVVDGLDRIIEASVWGAADKAVVERVAAMKHPEKIKLCGETAYPDDALSEIDIFFYPLQRHHYGTGENALVEAMSVGAVPLVLNNPAEKEIVVNNESGFVANSIGDCSGLLDKLITAPLCLERLSQGAVKRVAETKAPWDSAKALMSLWLNLIPGRKKHCDFRSVVGETPADWFLATQRLPGADWKPDEIDPGAIKGSLAHFKKVFVDDSSFSRL